MPDNKRGTFEGGGGSGESTTSRPRRARSKNRARVTTHASLHDVDELALSRAPHFSSAGEGGVGSGAGSQLVRAN